MPCQCVASDRVPVAVLCVYVSIYESVCVCGGEGVGRHSEDCIKNVYLNYHIMACVFVMHALVWAWVCVCVMRKG
jgi:hypothetical protein